MPPFTLVRLERTMMSGEGVRKVDIANRSENFPIYFEDDKLEDRLKNFQYVCCNIPGPGTDTTNFEATLEGCTCSSTACDIAENTECTCMRFGPTYTSDGRLKHLPSTDIEKGVFNECNLLCSCTSTCSNRVVQHGITTRLEVFWSEEKSLCLRTLEPIKCGSFVCEYAGEVLTKKEARKRAELQSSADMNYIFVLNEHVASGVLTTYIDPCYIGNIGRFINHSCEPNLAVYTVRVHNLVPKVCLFSARDISANEELTYNYGRVEYEDDSFPDRLQKICKCYSEKCKGFLPCDLSALK